MAFPFHTHIGPPTFNAARRLWPTRWTNAGERTPWPATCRVARPTYAESTHARMHARANPLRRRPANSYARRWTTYVMASMALVRRSKRSPLACRRLVEQGYNSRLPVGARRHPERGGAPSARSRLGKRGVAGSRHGGGLAQPAGRSDEKGAGRHPIDPSRSKVAPLHVVEVPRRGRQRRSAAHGPRVRRGAPRPRVRRPALAPVLANQTA
jgi:hypothetical protein